MNRLLTIATFIFVVAFLAYMTSACTTPKERIVVQTVKVPVSVPCKVKLPERPVFADEAVDPYANVFVKAQAVTAAMLERMAYEIELEAAARACG